MLERLIFITLVVSTVLIVAVLTVAVVIYADGVEPRPLRPFPPGHDPNNSRSRFAGRRAASRDWPKSRPSSSGSASLEGTQPRSGAETQQPAAYRAKAEPKDERGSSKSENRSDEIDERGILTRSAITPNEIPPQSINSSARSRNDSGIVRPSAFAVLRLMINSNLVGTRGVSFDHLVGAGE
jgi:hypothetical protein